MQESSSGGNRNSRNRQSNSRGEGRGGSRGDRGRSRNRQRGDGRRESSHRSDRPEEFRPSEIVGRNRRSDSKPAPKLTAFQKFIKLITFGLVDPSPKKPAAKSPSRSEDRPPREPKPPRPAREGDEGKRERRAPAFVEPTTPRLYVGNLSYEITNADLEVLFGAHGSVVEAAVVTQGGSDRSKGFAFVEMGSVEEAKAAATALNDHEVKGRKMLVTGAKSEGRIDEKSQAPRAERAERGERRERSERGERGERKERGRGGRSRSAESDEIDKPSRKVRPLVIETVTSPSLSVSNVNAEASDTDITDLFAGIGIIASREETGPGKDERTRNHRIDLSSTEEAQKAVELLHGKCFMGHEIEVTGATTGA
jgi:RNA recognition motif-containing protein